LAITAEDNAERKLQAAVYDADKWAELEAKAKTEA
jgi:hypothetical protein